MDEKETKSHHATALKQKEEYKQKMAGKVKEKKRAAKATEKQEKADKKQSTRK